VLAIFHVLFDARDESFGNARLARNIFERTINNQANRIISLANLTDEVLCTLEATDIPTKLELQTIENSQSID
jgi:AAA lid domain-containing protein